MLILISSVGRHLEWPPSWIATLLECLSFIFVLYVCQCTGAESFFWSPRFIPNLHVASTRISASIMLTRTPESFKQLFISLVILVGFNSSYFSIKAQVTRYILCRDIGLSKTSRFKVKY